MDTPPKAPEELIGPLIDRRGILNEAKRLTCGPREEEYGSATAQMECTGSLTELYRAYTRPFGKEGKYCDGHDAAIALFLNKLSRIMNGEFKADNYVDAVAYLAMAFEAEATHRTNALQLQNTESQNDNVA